MIERGMRAEDAHVGDLVVYWGHSHTRKEYHGVVAEVLGISTTDNFIRVRTPRYNDSSKTFTEWQSADIFEPYHRLSNSDELDSMFEEMLETCK